MTSAPGDGARAGEGDVKNGDSHAVTPAGLTGWTTLGSGDRRPLAGFDRRLGARIADWALTGLVTYLLWRAFASGDRGWFATLFFLALIFWLVGVLYEVTLTSISGRTVGKMLFGAKVVRADNGKTPGWWKSFVRHLLLNVLNHLPVLGNLATMLIYLSPAFSNTLQGLHDRAAATVVINTRPRGGGEPDPAAADGPLPGAASHAPAAMTGLVVLGNREQRRLAGLGRRLSARVIDFIVMLAVAALLLILWFTRSLNTIQTVIQDSLNELTASLQTAIDSLGDLGDISDLDSVGDTLRSLWDSARSLWNLFVQALNDVLSAFLSALRQLLTTIIWIIVIAVLYQIVLIALWGWTVGKLAVGIRVVRVNDGRAPGWVKSIVRYIVINLPFLSWLVQMSPLFYDSRQGWHDRAASTIVIRRPRRKPKTKPDPDSAGSPKGETNDG